MSFNILEPSYNLPFKYIVETDVIVVINTENKNEKTGPVFNRMNDLLNGCFGAKYIENYRENNITFDIYSLNKDFMLDDSPTNYTEFRNIVGQNPEYITSYAKLKYNKFSEIMEVWDVCTSIEYRSLGYSTEILKTLDLLEKYYPEFLNQLRAFWLCIDVKGNYIPLMKHYGKNGFENPAITNYTSDNVSLINGLDNFYLSMIKYTKGSLLKQSRVYSYYDDYYIEKYLTEIIPYHGDFLINSYSNNIPLYLHIDSFRHIFLNYLGYGDINPTLPTSHNEHSGSFIVGNYENKNVLFLDHQSILQGNFESVNINKYSNITFHTHPRRAAEYYKVPIAWPSIADFMVAIYNRNIIMINMVFSKEGLYLYMINDDFKNFLNSLPSEDQINITERYYKEYITKYEKGIFSNDTGVSYDINEYISDINSRSLEIYDDNRVFRFGGPPVKVKFISIHFFHEGIEELSTTSLSKILF